MPCLCGLCYQFHEKETWNDGGSELVDSMTENSKRAFVDLRTSSGNGVAPLIIQICFASLGNTPS